MSMHWEIELQFGRGSWGGDRDSRQPSNYQSSRQDRRARRRRAKLEWIGSRIEMDRTELSDGSAKEGTTEPDVIVLNSGGIKQGDTAEESRKRRNTLGESETHGTAAEDSHQLH